MLFALVYYLWTTSLNGTIVNTFNIQSDTHTVFSKRFNPTKWVDLKSWEINKIDDMFCHYIGWKEGKFSKFVGGFFIESIPQDSILPEKLKRHQYATYYLKLQTAQISYLRTNDFSPFWLLAALFGYNWL